MIQNIGVDIVQIPRIQQVFARWGEVFVHRILTIAEYEQYLKLTPRQAINYLAKRFAAKEAVAKALGTGIGRPYQFVDIEILNHHTGQPYVAINCKYELGNKKFFISIADDPPVAIAFVIIC